MSAGASPWDVLLRAPAWRRPAPDAAGQARDGTKLARLLAELAARDSASTHTLAVCVDLTPRQVWGLLKQPRAVGQVKFEAGRWSLVSSFQGRDVERAVALLRSKGWRVVPANDGVEPHAPQR